MRVNNTVRLAIVALLCLTVQRSPTTVATGAVARLDPGVSASPENVSLASGVATKASEASTTVRLPTERETEAPTVLRAAGSDKFDQITVTFSEPVISVTSTVRSNYQVSGDVTVISAAQVDPVMVRLMTSRMEPDTVYTLTVANVVDLAGNVITIPGDKITFRSFAFTIGMAKSEIWTGIDGATVADLLADPRFPTSPDLVEYALKLEWGAKDREGVGVRVSAFLTPLESASYVFYMASSHEAELYLSTDENPENRALIASEHVSQLARSWSSSNSRLGCPDACENRSAPIRLAAGTRYLIELIFTDGIGVGYSGVTWAREGKPSPINGTRPLSGNQIGVFADPSPSIKGEGGGGSSDATITGVSLHGGNIVIKFSSGTLESSDDITGPWTAVPGISSPVSFPIAGDKKFYRTR
ncbi:MAG: Ig-like domain-containing protein [Verrucomicrobia bacterium]|nr:Ig-like domain-containing protein [Verrucomicrobiota bacterium]